MSAGISLVPLIVVAATAVAGVVLLVRGVWPRRRGDTPYCRKCNYNLTGLTSDRCPECGSTVAGHGIVYGEQRRRPVVAVIGIFLLALTTPLLATALKKVDWYRWTPTSLLMMRIQGADAQVARQAWKELDRRISGNGLSNGQHGRLIELSLREQVATRPSFIRQYMLDYLGDCLAGNRLSKKQETRFFEQLADFDLKVRPTVGLGYRVPYQVDINARGCSKGLWWAITPHAQVTLDGKPVPGQGNRTIRFCASGYHPARMSFDCRSVGRHVLTATPQVVVYRGPTYNAQASTVIHRRQIALEATFEVVAVEPPRRIDRAKHASLGLQLRSLIVPRDFEWLQNPDHAKGAGYTLSGQIELRALPVDVAFGVIARKDGREYRMDSIGLSRRRIAMTYSKALTYPVESEGAIPGQPSPEVDIILRSSEAWARGTVDLFEIWDGELVFENIPVKVVPAASPSSATEKEDVTD